MPFDDSLRLLKAMADGTRLMLLQHLIREPMYVEELARRMSLTPSTVSFHLKKLESAGIVRRYRDQYYAMYKVNDAILGMSLQQLVQSRGPKVPAEDDRWKAYCESVLSTYLPEGHITQLPVQKKKRRIVLDHVAQAFRPGVVYAEKALDEIIGKFSADHASIRRLMVEEGLMTRTKGMYERTKGVSAMATTEQRELKRAYKMRDKTAGVFAVINEAKSKSLLGSSLNIDGPLNRERFLLTNGMHKNLALQEDWNRQNGESFKFVILEVLPPQAELTIPVETALERLEEKWWNKLQPTGEQGYNPDRRFRQA